MRITNRQTLIAGVIGLYLTLALHDRNLYPSLSWTNSLFLSLLRLALILLPVVFGFLIVRESRWSTLRVLIFLCWLAILPYTIYSSAEIRHVAELCRLPAERVYTQQCVQSTWTLLPVFIYALAGTVSFVFSVVQVSGQLLSESTLKRLFIFALCLYCSYASVFGLYTRINVWSAILHPTTAAQHVSLIVRPDFFLNVGILTLFFAGMTFVVTCLFKNVYRYLS